MPKIMLSFLLGRKTFRTLAQGPLASKAPNDRYPIFQPIPPSHPQAPSPYLPSTPNQKQQQQQKWVSSARVRPPRPPLRHPTPPPRPRRTAHSKPRTGSRARTAGGPATTSSPVWTATASSTAYGTRSGRTVRVGLKGRGWRGSALLVGCVCVFFCFFLFFRLILSGWERLGGRFWRVKTWGKGSGEGKGAGDGEGRKKMDIHS